MATFHTVGDPRGVVRQVIRTSPTSRTVSRREAEEMRASAIDEFNRLSRGESGAARSPTTPPMYVNAFRVVSLPDGSARLINEDPGAIFVEFGAHAGGKTFVLGYAPMRKAVDRKTRR